MNTKTKAFLQARLDAEKMHLEQLLLDFIASDGEPSLKQEIADAEWFIRHCWGKLLKQENPIFPDPKYCNCDGGGECRNLLPSLGICIIFDDLERECDLHPFLKHSDCKALFT